MLSYESHVESLGAAFLFKHMDRLPHIFVNYVPLGTDGIKLGFMCRRGGEEQTEADALKIKQRLESHGCRISEDICAPSPNEEFFWFRVEERSQPPTVRQLLEDYEDVIVR